MTRIDTSSSQVAFEDDANGSPEPSIDGPPAFVPKERPMKWADNADDSMPRASVPVEERHAALLADVRKELADIDVVDAKNKDRRAKLQAIIGEPKVHTSGYLTHAPQSINDATWPPVETAKPAKRKYTRRTQAEKDAAMHAKADKAAKADESASLNLMTSGEKYTLSQLKALIGGKPSALLANALESGLVKKSGKAGAGAIYTRKS